LGQEKLARLLRLAYDHGVTFWDAAGAYGTHPHIAHALREVPRDNVILATKTMARQADKVTQDVERFLRELGTDSLDIVILHFMTQPDWPRRYADALEALSRAKEAGQVRAVGVSCHGLRALRAAAEIDWPDVVMVRINPNGVNMDAAPSKVVPLIEKMYTAGKAIYGMKILGAGRLTGQARASIKYVFQLGVVHAITIGISHREHLYQDVKLVEKFASRYPLRPIHLPTTNLSNDDNASDA
jgi:aryl-alcohol dehydrogenase-like predicted oxidoreductase